MQSNVNGPLKLNRRKMHSGQYDVPPPSDGGMWTQLHEQVKAKTQSE